MSWTGRLVFLLFLIAMWLVMWADGTRKDAE